MSNVLYYKGKAYGGTPKFYFASVEQMNEELEAGNIPDTATCYVKSGDALSTYEIINGEAVAAGGGSDLPLVVNDGKLCIRYEKE